MRNDPVRMERPCHHVRDRDATRASAVVQANIPPTVGGRPSSRICLSARELLTLRDGGKADRIQADAMMPKAAKPRGESKKRPSQLRAERDVCV